MTSDDKITTSIPVALFNKLHADIRDAQLKTEELRRELEAERAKTPEDRLTACVALIDALKVVADHAVANLSPEFIRDLPAEAFTAAAGLVASVAGATQRDSERAGVWRERAELIQTWRDKRKARGWGEDAEPTPVKAPRKARTRR